MEKKRYTNNVLDFEIIEDLKFILFNLRLQNHSLNSFVYDFYSEKEFKEKTIILLKDIGVYIKKHNNKMIVQSKYDFLDLLKNMIEEKEMEDLKSYQFYSTKETLAKKLIKLADFKTNNEMTLEPSAGQGAIAEHIPSKNLHCVEYSKINSEVLKKKGFVVFNDDFIHFSNTTNYRYDRVVMSPPFLGGKGVQHVINAYNLLNSGGVLVSILPDKMKNESIIKNEVHYYSDIMKGGFENTDVGFVILKIVKE